MTARAKLHNKIPADQAVTAAVVSPPAPVEGLRSRKKRETRERLINVARELFSQRGYDETTIEAIADLAGVSKPTVFNYFASKRALLLELATAADRAFERVVLTAFEQPFPTSRRLEVFFTGLSQNLERSPALTRVLMVEAVKAMSEESDAARKHGFLRTEKALIRLLREGVAHGDVRDDFNVSLMAQLIIGAYTNVLLMWLADPNYKVKLRLKQSAHFMADAIRPHPR